MVASKSKGKGKKPGTKFGSLPAKGLKAKDAAAVRGGLLYKFGTVFTTKVDWRSSGDEGSDSPKKP